MLFVVWHIATLNKNNRGRKELADQKRSVALRAAERPSLVQSDMTEKRAAADGEQEGAEPRKQQKTGREA